MAEEKKKTKRPTAQKRMIQNEKRRQINRAFKSRVRGAVRTLEKSPSMEQLNQVYALTDKGVKRGVFKRNKASRLKSRCAALAQSK